MIGAEPGRGLDAPPPGTRRAWHGRRPTGLGREPVLARRAFAGLPSEVRTARHWLAAVVGEMPCAPDALLVLSELAANAVSHSDSRMPGGTFTVRVALASDVVRIEVADGGGPWRDREDQIGQRGRGLMIIAAIASSWGIAGDDKGRTTWCELACAPGEPGRAPRVTGE